MTTELLSNRDVEPSQSRDHVRRTWVNTSASLRTSMELRHQTRSLCENLNWTTSRMKRSTHWKRTKDNHSSWNANLQMVGQSPACTGWSRQHLAGSKPSITHEWLSTQKGTCGSRTWPALMPPMTRTTLVQLHQHSVTNTNWEIVSCWKSSLQATPLKIVIRRLASTFHVVTKLRCEVKRSRFTVFMAGRRCLKRFGVKTAGRYRGVIE